jgi:hypothetical protein
MPQLPGPAYHTSIAVSGYAVSSHPSRVHDHPAGEATVAGIAAADTEFRRWRKLVTWAHAGTEAAIAPIVAIERLPVSKQASASQRSKLQSWVHAQRATRFLVESSLAWMCAGPVRSMPYPRVGPRGAPRRVPDPPST